LPEDQGPSDRPEWLTKATTPTYCYRHPDRQTGLRCSRCDRPICGECANPAPVGQLCPDDAKSTVRVRGLPGSQTPVVTYTLLGLNTLLLFAAALLTGSGFGLLDPSATALCRLGALNAAAIAESGQWWRLLTVMVLHGGLLHWAFNSWALWAFGPTLESLLGRARFVALYVGTGLVGAGASFAFNQTTLGVGASGAIFGLLGALVAYFFRRRRVGGSAPLQSLLLVLLLNLFIASRNPSIDNLAHIGGFLAGQRGEGFSTVRSIPMHGTGVARNASGTLDLGPITIHMYGLMLLAGIALVGGGALVLLVGRIRDRHATR
jgi:membrane associated rhomboid family serine protease